MFWSFISFLALSGSPFSIASERLHHISGSVYTIRGKTTPQGRALADYYSTGNATWFESVPENQVRWLRSPLSPIRGGFERMPDLATSYGFNLDPVAPALWERTLTAANGLVSLNEGFRTHLRVAYQSQDTFECLKRYLEERGQIAPVQTGGRYTPTPLRIISQTSESSSAGLAPPALLQSAISPGSPRSLATESRTLFHELLHYVFDKMDSRHSEVISPGGKDHFFIAPLEERFVLTRLLLDGQSPLVDEIHSLYGYLQFGKVGEKLQQLLMSRNWTELERYTRSQEGAYTETIQTALLPPASSRQVNLVGGREEPGWNLTEDEIQDIGYLQAVNAAILVGSFRNLLILRNEPESQGISQDFTALLASPTLREANHSLLRKLREKLQAQGQIISPWQALQEALLAIHASQRR